MGISDSDSVSDTDIFRVEESNLRFNMMHQELRDALHAAYQEHISKKNEEIAQEIKAIQDTFLQAYSEMLEQQNRIIAGLKQIKDKQEDLTRMIRDIRNALDESLTFRDRSAYQKQLRELSAELRKVNRIGQQLKGYSQKHHDFVSVAKSIAIEYIEYAKQMKEFALAPSPATVSEIKGISTRVARMSKDMTRNEGLVKRKLQKIDKELCSGSDFLKEFTAVAVAVKYREGRGKSWMKYLGLQRARTSRESQLNKLQKAVDDYKQLVRVKYIEDPLGTLDSLSGNSELNAGITAAIAEILFEIKKEKEKSDYWQKSSLEQICDNMCNKLGVKADDLVAKYERAIKLESKAKGKPGLSSP